MCYFESAKPRYTYIFQREDGTWRKRTLHRNLLLPIEIIDPHTKHDRPAPKPRKTQPKEREQVHFGHQREQVDFGHQRDADSHQRDADLSDGSDNEVYLTQVPVP